MSKISYGINLGKESAARAALEFVKNEMTVGLGTGSTAKIFVDLLAQKVFTEGLKIRVLATSSATNKQARQLGLPLTTIDDVKKIDLVVDGADEVDPKLIMIKGGGGALLQEKIVAESSERMIVIVDESKIVDKLGKFPLPVEVIKFGSDFTRKRIINELKKLGYTEISANWRFEEERLFLTDEGHYILDLELNQVTEHNILNRSIKGVTGVVETGLFINLADRVLIGHNNGDLEIIE